MTLGQYGPRVIGEKQYRREQRIIETAAHKYGPRVVDAEDFDEPEDSGGVPGVQAAAETEAAPEAEAPVEGEPAPDAETEAAESGAETEGEKIDAQEAHPAAGADQYLSVREMGAALDANPALVDVFLEPELGRETGPRKTALTAMERAEHERAGGARQEVLDRIRDAQE